MEAYEFVEDLTVAVTRLLEDFHRKKFTYGPASFNELK